MHYDIRMGWYTLLIAMCGDLGISFILSLFYKGYSNVNMAISELGTTSSPVRIPFNIWMLLEGVFFLIAVPTLFHCYSSTSKKITLILTLFIAVFAIGACIVTCFFSVDEANEMISLAAKVHGAGSVTGFMLFLFTPLLIGILSFKNHDHVAGIVAIVSFALAFVFFVLFVMSDKPEFANTFVAKKGLWQRMNLLFMYIPFGYIAVKNIIICPSIE